MLKPEGTKEWFWGGDTRYVSRAVGGYCGAESVLAVCVVLRLCAV